MLSWQSKGLSNGSIEPPTTSNYSLNPRLSYYGTKIRVQFTGSCLKQPKFTFTHEKIVNIYIVYELGASSSHISDPTIKNCLFGGFGQNVLIFGADTSSFPHIDNKKKDILVLGKGPTKGLETL